MADNKYSLMQLHEYIHYLEALLYGLKVNYVKMDQYFQSKLDVDDEVKKKIKLSPDHHKILADIKILEDRYAR